MTKTFESGAHSESASLPPPAPNSIEAPAAASSKPQPPLRSKAVYNAVCTTSTSTSGSAVLMSTAENHLNSTMNRISLAEVIISVCLLLLLWQPVMLQLLFVECQSDCDLFDSASDVTLALMSPQMSYAPLAVFRFAINEFTPILRAPVPPEPNVRCWCAFLTYFSLPASRNFIVIVRRGALAALDSYRYHEGALLCSQEDSVTNLDELELRALLDEAITYKTPKDREGKSKLFNVSALSPLRLGCASFYWIFIILCVFQDAAD